MVGRHFVRRWQLCCLLSAQTKAPSLNLETNGSQSNAQLSHANPILNKLERCIYFMIHRDHSFATCKHARSNVTDSVGVNPGGFGGPRPQILRWASWGSIGLHQI